MYPSPFSAARFWHSRKKTTFGLQESSVKLLTNCTDLLSIIIHSRSVTANPVLLSRTRNAIRMVIDRCSLFFIVLLPAAGFALLAWRNLNSGPKLLIIRRFPPLHIRPFLISSLISSGEWVVSTFSTRSALSRSTVQFQHFSSPLRKGVTPATTAAAFDIGFEF